MNDQYNSIYDQQQQKINYIYLDPIESLLKINKQNEEKQIIKEMDVLPIQDNIDQNFFKQQKLQSLQHKKFQKIHNLTQKLNIYYDSDDMKEEIYNSMKRSSQLDQNSKIELIISDQFNIKKNKKIEQNPLFTKKQMKQTKIDDFFHQKQCEQNDKNDEKLNILGYKNQNSHNKFNLYLNKQISQSLENKGLKLTTQQIQLLIKKQEDKQNDLINKRKDQIFEQGNKTKQLIKYKNFMEQDENKNNRLNLLLSYQENQNNEQIANQNINIMNIQKLQNRTNFNFMLKFILTQNYMKLENQKVKNSQCIPTKFNNAYEYITIFQFFFLQECCAQINQVLQKITKVDKYAQNGKKYRISILPNKNNDYFTYFDIKTHDALIDPSDPNSENLPIDCTFKQKQGPVELFDINLIGSNYLVLLSNEQNNFDLNLLQPSMCFQKHQINKQKQFLLLGFIEKINNDQEDQNTIKIKTYLNQELFQQKFFFQKDILTGQTRQIKWISAYIYPIDKISTQIREFLSLINIEYQEISKNLFNPKIALNFNSYNNNLSFEQFFSSIENFYNQSQLQSIKNVCLQKDGISLLQGPPGTGKTHTLIGILSGLYFLMQNQKDNYKKVIMVCAPSNAAIDEIITRLVKFGLYNENGEQIKVKITRVGVIDKNTKEIVQRVSADHQVQEQINFQLKYRADEKGEAITCKEINAEIEKINDKINKIEKEELQTEEENFNSKQALIQLNQKRRCLISKYQQIKNDKYYQVEKYQEILKRVLDETEIVCCTLGSSGNEKMQFFKNNIFALVVDEATQCTEISNIVPLQLNINRMILIGDPQQLPATTFSPDSNITLYNRSLFERLLQNNMPRQFLDTQYRMHSLIRKFPSQQFYDDNLQDANIIGEREFPQFLQFIVGNKEKSINQKTIFFIDISYSQEKCVDKSFLNYQESQIVFLLCKKLLKNIQSIVSQQKNKIQNQMQIGIISPYKQQVKHLKEVIKRNFKQSLQEYIYINTIDSFQGQEKDAIIFTTVRSNNNKSYISEKEIESQIGFLQDARRMNVALTRSKFLLIVLGNSRTLATNEIWAQYIKWLQMNNYYILVDDFNNAKEIIQTIFAGQEIPKQYKQIDKITQNLLDIWDNFQEQEKQNQNNFIGISNKQSQQEISGKNIAAMSTILQLNEEEEELQGNNQKENTKTQEKAINSQEQYKIRNKKQNKYKEQLLNKLKANIQTFNNQQIQNKKVEQEQKKQCKKQQFSINEIISKINL